MALDPITAYVYNSATSTLAGSTTPSFTPSAGEIITVKTIAADSTGTLTAPTSAGLTFTSRITNVVSSTCKSTIWTAPVPAGQDIARTVSHGAMTVQAMYHSSIVTRWPVGSFLAGTPATNATKTGSGLPSSVLTAVGTGGGVLDCLNGDWSAKAPTTRAFTGISPTDQSFHDRSPNEYTGYFWYNQVLASGAQTIGMSLPAAQTWAMLGVEIQYTPPSYLFELLTPSPRSF